MAQSYDYIFQTCGLYRGLHVSTGCGFVYQSAKDCAEQCGPWGGCQDQIFIPTEGLGPSACDRGTLMYPGCGYVYQSSQNRQQQCGSTTNSLQYIPRSAESSVVLVDEKQECLYYTMEKEFVPNVAWGQTNNYERTRITSLNCNSVNIPANFRLNEWLGPDGARWNNYHKSVGYPYAKCNRLANIYGIDPYRSWGSASSSPDVQSVWTSLKCNGPVLFARNTGGYSPSTQDSSLPAATVSDSSAITTAASGAPSFLLPLLVVFAVLFIVLGLATGFAVRRKRQSKKNALQQRQLQQPTDNTGTGTKVEVGNQTKITIVDNSHTTPILQ